MQSKIALFKLIFLMSCCLDVNAQKKWQLGVQGGFSLDQFKLIDPGLLAKSSTLGNFQSFSLGRNISPNLTIESGVQFKAYKKNVVYTSITTDRNSEIDLGRSSILQIPIRFKYDIPLNSKKSYWLSGVFGYHFGISISKPKTRIVTYHTYINPDVGTEETIEFNVKPESVHSNSLHILESGLEFSYLLPSGLSIGVMGGYFLSLSELYSQNFNYEVNIINGLSERNEGSLTTKGNYMAIGLSIRSPLKNFKSDKLKDIFKPYEKEVKEKKVNSSFLDESNSDAHYYLGAGAPFYNSTQLLNEIPISLNKTAIYSIRSTDNWLFKGQNSSAGQILYRSFRWLAIDFPISLYAAEIPHEIMGHGFQWTNYGGKFSMKIDFPPLPYNLDYESGADGSGEIVSQGQRKDWQNFMDANGIQVEKHIARQIKLKFWQSGSADYDLATLMLKTDHAPFWYNIFTQQGDIGAIANGYNDLGNNNYSETDIQLRSGIISSLNPINIFTWYSWLTYLSTGRSKVHLPYLKMNQIKWLPGLAYDVTSFGEEYLLDNYYRWGQRWGIVTFGVGTVQSQYRLGILINNLWQSPNKQQQLGIEVHAWEQKEFGFSPQINYETFIIENLGARVSAGHKSYGYLNGTGLKEGTLMNVGLVYKANR